jgi:hypothetical protein
MSTLREELLEQGFNPAEGFVIFEWNVRFKRPHSERSIRRKLRWNSKLLDIPFHHLGYWSYYLEGDSIPQERHRNVSCYFVARDNQAVYIFSEYDGNEWITRVPLSEEELLQSESLPRS